MQWRQRHLGLRTPIWMEPEPAQKKLKWRWSKKKKEHYTMPWAHRLVVLVTIEIPTPTTTVHHLSSYSYPGPYLFWIKMCFHFEGTDDILFSSVHKKVWQMQSLSSFPILFGCTVDCTLTLLWLNWIALVRFVRVQFTYFFYIPWDDKCTVCLSEVARWKNIYSNTQKTKPRIKSRTGIQLS